MLSVGKLLLSKLRRVEKKKLKQFSSNKPLLNKKKFNKKPTVKQTLI